MSSSPPPQPAPQPQRKTSFQIEQEEETRFNKSLKSQRWAARRAANRLGVSSSGTAEATVSLLGGRASAALM